MTQPIEILLVEDNEDDVVLTRRAFQAIQHVTITHAARDGEEAMAMLRKPAHEQSARLPGLVLLDINLPKKSGFEVLHELKSDPALRHLPVVMLTTSQREEDVVKSYRYGACSYIPKPVEPKRFLEVLRQFELYWTGVSLIPSQRSV